MLKSGKNPSGARPRFRRLRPHRNALNRLGLVLAGPTMLVLAGCGAANVTANTQSGALVVAPGSAILDTNCTGCNAADSHGNPVLQFTARAAQGSSSAVTWSVSGGDPAAGPGRIDSAGRYTPPSYLIADQA
jgi:hypothetical protein